MADADLQFYTRKEAAKMLRVGVGYVSKLIECGHLKAYRLTPPDRGRPTPRSRWRIPASAIDEYAQRGGLPKPPRPRIHDDDAECLDEVNRANARAGLPLISSLSAPGGERSAL